MDKIWDRKSIEVGGHWPLWWGLKNRMTAQNRQKSNATKKKRDYNQHIRTMTYTTLRHEACFTFTEVWEVYNERFTESRTKPVFLPHNLRHQNHTYVQSSLKCNSVKQYHGQRMNFCEDKTCCINQ